ICVGYEVEGEHLSEMPMTQTAFHHATPVYEEMDGWWEDISKARSWDDLPAAAQRYVTRIEELSGARVSVVGVGPGREENVVLHPRIGGDLVPCVLPCSARAAASMPWPPRWPRIPPSPNSTPPPATRGSAGWPDCTRPT